ncbi:MAG TPA: tetratricopeptide repeat protein [Gemmatimonadales bacterium]|nr:tetratricopeptide repeat protein [Gemmatimonadales bacterium]
MSTTEIAKLESRWRENPQGLTFAPLAEAHRKLKDPERALEILRPGLERHPDYIPANIVLGRCHWDLNDLAAAEQAFNHVLELDGENVIALRALADIAERQTRYNEAETWLERVLVVDRSNDDAREQLARLRTQARAPAAEASGTLEPLAAGAAAVEAAPADHAADPADSGAEQAAAVEPLAAEPAVSEAQGTVPESAAEPLALEEPMAAAAGWSSQPFMPGVEHAEIEHNEIELSGSDAGLAATTSAAAEGLETLEPTVQAGSDDLAFERVERSEDIMLSAGGGSEFQVPNAVEDLIGGYGQDPTALSADAFGAAPPDARTDAEGVEEQQADGEPRPDREPAVAQAVESSSTEAPSPEAAPSVAAAPEATAPEAAPSSAPPSAVAAGDSAAFVEEPAPALVITETMAEIYLRQGHAGDALVIYRELARRRPDDAALRQRVAELSERETPPQQHRPTYAARETGGQSVAELFRALLAARPPHVAAPRRPPPPSQAAPAERPSGHVDSAASSAVEGAPTRPAGDPLSLDSLFGDAPPASAPAVPHPADARGAGAAVSFDDFFGGRASATPERAAGPARSGGTPRPGAARAGDDDLDQFHAWLQSLKR